MIYSKNIYIYQHRTSASTSYIISLVLVCWFGDPLSFNQWQLQYIFVQVFNIECNSNNCRVALDSCKQREPGVLLFNSCNQRQPTTNTALKPTIANPFLIITSPIISRKNDVTRQVLWRSRTAPFPFRWPWKSKPKTRQLELKVKSCRCQNININWATKKTRLTFQNTGWLIGILIIAYYNPYITG